MWKYPKVPKVAFTYWAGPMTKLHYLVLQSVLKFNSDWKILFYQPVHEYKGEKTWQTIEHSIKYAGVDYRTRLSELKGLEIINIDFEKIGFRNDVPEVYKSNFLTYYRLSNEGGVWFDTDVLFIKPLNELDLSEKIIYGDFETLEVAISYEPVQGYFSTGILMGAPNTEFFKTLLKQLYKSFDPKVYMSATNLLYPQLFKNIQGIRTVFPKLYYANLGMDIFYPYRWNEMETLFESNKGLERITSKVIGIHWFNGSPVTEKFLNEGNYTKDVLINQIIKKYL